MFSPVRLRKIAAVVTCLLPLCVAQYARATAGLAFAGLVQTIDTGSLYLEFPSSLLVDSSGDVFIDDTENSRIIEVNPLGTASVLTITGLSSALSDPEAIAIDGSGNLYIADTGNSRVVEVSSSGAGSVISTGGVTLNQPQGIALDQSGDIFIADTNNNRIVEVTSGGAAAALTINVSSGSATLSYPLGLAVNTAGTLYIADFSHDRIVTVASGSTTGVVETIAGLSPGLSGPFGVAVDRIGNVYVADLNHSRIVGIDTAGNGYSLYVPNATLNFPEAVAVDNFGAVYIANSGVNQVLVLDPYMDGNPSAPDYSSSLNKSAVGFGHITLGSSTPTTLTLSFTVGNPVSGLGGVNVFTSGAQGLDFQIVSGGNTTCSSSSVSGDTCTVEISFLPTAPGLRKGALVLYDPSMNPVLTLPLYGFSDAPVAALAPNLGTVISTGGVPLPFPFQIALDGAGNIYDANNGGNLVKIPAGGGSASVVTPSGYTFSSEVTGVAVDGAGNLFVSDHLNSRIIVITPGGVASVLSISGLSPTLGYPTALAFDGAGNLYISDYEMGRVVEVSSLSVAGSTSSGIGTVINTGSYTTSSTGITGVAVDSMGNIYIPDGYAGTDPSRVIKVTAAGAVSLLTPTGITFSRPEGVTVDGMGNIYVNDGGHNRIVEITSAGVASVLAISGLPSPTTLGAPFGVTVDPFGNLYIPDSGNNRVLFVNVSGAALKFATSTRQGTTDTTDGAKTATVTNLGNQPLIFSTNPTYTASFSNNSGDTNPCTSSTSLSSGINCDVSVSFTPQATGSLSAGITVTNNTLNIPGATEQVSVSGTGTNPGDTTSTSVTISPTSLTNGQTATITASVTDTTSGHTATIPTGPVTFTDTLGSTTISLNGGTAVSLSNGTATLTGVLLSGIGSHTITANYNGISGTYLTSNNTTTASLALAPATVTGPATQPVSVTPGQTGSATVTVTGPYTTITVPSGSILYSILNSSSTSVASGYSALTAGSTSSTASIPIPNTLASGNYTISVTYYGDNNYKVTSTATTIQVQVGQITPTITWNPSATTITYGATLSGILDATAAAGGSSVPGSFAYTATPSGGNASAVTSASIPGAGGYTLTATFTPTNTTTYAAATSTISIVVNKATPTALLVSSANPVLVTNAVTFTTTVASTAGSPGGSVSFLDGTTLLGSVTLSSGAASYTTSSLAAATHSITAVYSGNSNFVSVTSSAMAELVQDYSLSISGSGGGGSSGGGIGSSGGDSQTVVPGGTATYTLALGPSNGATFPAPVTLSLSGLPPGATGTITPNVLQAGTSLTNVTLSIQLPQVTAEMDRQKQSPVQKVPPMLWSVLLIPFAARLRRARKYLGKALCLLALLAGGLAAFAGLSGCGSTSGFFGQQAESYTVTITATSGALSHSTTVTLNVE